MQSHGVLAAKCVTKTGWSASLQTMRSQSRVKCRKSTSRSTRRQRRTLELSETIFIELVAVPAKVAGPATVAWAASAQQIQAAKVAVSAPPSTLAPSCQEFSDFIGKFGKSTTLTRKELKMAWCLAEGVKVLDQRAIQSASLIALMRDERHGRVAVRFRTVSSDLSVRSGFLGQGRFEGTGAEQLVKNNFEYHEACLLKILWGT